MVDLAGALPRNAAPGRLIRREGQQRAFWLAYDMVLALLVMAAAGDMPNRWHVASLVWLLAYTMAALRIMALWPAFFRMLRRNWQYLLYPAVCAASVVWSVARSTTMVGAVQLTMTVLIACYLGWRFKPQQLVLLIFSTTLTGAVASVLNLGLGVFQPVFSDVGGLLGIYTNKNMLGHYSLFALLIALSLALSTPAETPRAARWIAMPALAICAAMVVLSKSMTAVVLMPCYTGLILLMNRERLPHAARHLTLMAAVVIVALAPMLLTLAGIDPMAELFAATGKDASLTGRTDIWAVARGLIAQSPISGYGFGAFWVNDRFAAEQFEIIRAGNAAPSFHNFLADVGVGTGVIGMAAILAVVLTTLGRAFRVWRASGSAMSVCWLVLSILPINVGMVEPYLYRQHEFMLGWMIMLGISLGEWRGIRPRATEAELPGPVPAPARWPAATGPEQEFKR